MRDHGVEAYDPPPDGGLPKELVPAASGTNPAGRNGTDLRRADDTRSSVPWGRGALPPELDIQGLLRRRS